MGNIKMQSGHLIGSIKAQDVLKAEIKSQGTLNGTISRTIEEVERQSKTIEINENGTFEVIPDGNKVLEKVTVKTDIIGGDVEEYKGSYEVVPKLEEQILDTSFKVMRDDVKIKEIPITTVANTAGGNTVIIGG